MKRLILATILFLFPFYAQAGFPEGENGYDLKKIEESFRLPCDEIGNDDCIAIALGVGEGDLNNPHVDFLKRCLKE